MTDISWGATARSASRATVQSADGLSLNVIDFGGESGPPILLVHGSFGHARVWDPLVACLPARQRVFALDLPGHGDSAWAPDERRYAFDRLVDDIASVVKSIDGRPVLAGHSVGSALAMLYSARYSSSLTGVVLMDIDPWPPARQADHLNAVGQLPPKVYPTFEGAVARESRVAPAAAPETHRHLALHGYRETGDGWIQKFDQAFLRCIRTWDARPLLARIEVPALVLRGSDSTVMSDAGFAELLQSIPHAQGVHIPEAGHQLHLDQPSLAAAAITGFVSRLR